MKKIAVVDRDRCAACGVCVQACPRGAASVYRGCRAQVAEDKCVGCGLCGKQCPAACIAVTERSGAK